MHISVLRIFACMLALLCIQMSQAASSIKETAAIKNVRVWAGPEYTRVVFDLDAPVRHNLTLAENPDRIILDVPAATLTSSLSNVSLVDTPIAIIRNAVINKKDVQLVLDLKQK
ncbi:MAG: AMIN domain-containing protein, partial [Moraxellaceae bacterium]